MTVKKVLLSHSRTCKYQIEYSRFSTGKIRICAEKGRTKLKYGTAVLNQSSCSKLVQLYMYSCSITCNSTCIYQHSSTYIVANEIVDLNIQYSRTVLEFSTAFFDGDSNFTRTKPAVLKACTCRYGCVQATHFVLALFPV